MPFLHVLFYESSLSLLALACWLVAVTSQLPLSDDLRDGSSKLPCVVLSLSFFFPWLIPLLVVQFEIKSYYSLIYVFFYCCGLSRLIRLLVSGVFWVLIVVNLPVSFFLSTYCLHLQVAVR